MDAKAETAERGTREGGRGRGRVLALSGCGFEDRPAFGYAAT